MSKRPKKTDKWLTKVTDEHQADLRLKLGRRFTQVHQRRRMVRRVGGVCALVIALSAVQFSIWNSDWGQNEDTADLGTSDLESSHVAASSEGTPQNTNDRRHQQERSLDTGISLQLIDDNQLLDLLAEAGQPSVLVTVNGVKKALPLNKTAMK